ncbi:sensor histidine kinase [Catellatospora sichuanensis]|uniref:sensor histidine kinase n=1 Tax=Catellatospora sichuanensis TaxID=1969805 RepID=UPI001C906786|nr:sensor histidine kinase [Catellatospora sichuanensis]
MTWWLALTEAAVRAPVAPARRWLWPERQGRQVLVMIVWASLAVGLTLGAIAELTAQVQAPASLIALLGVAQAAPLAIAGHRPLLAWRIMSIGMLAGVVVRTGDDVLMPWAVSSWIAMVVVLFQVVGACERRAAAGACVLTALGVVLPAVFLTGMPLWYALILWAIIAMVFVFIDAVAGRSVAEARLAEQAELRRLDLARQAVLEERSRIARELHDVVAHHMSVVALQAEAAPYKMPDLSPAARETFGVVRDAARSALAETRRVVGLLRQDDDAAELLPQPGLDRLDALIASAGEAGLIARAAVTGMPRPLTAGVDLAAYRIVQEALSNAARHAPGARVAVDIRYGEDRLHVSVVDGGAAASRRGRPEPGGGHGLVGMRERVAMHEGVLTAGPRPGGGFAVIAELPY